MHTVTTRVVVCRYKKKVGKKNKKISEENVSCCFAQKKNVEKLSSG